MLDNPLLSGMLFPWIRLVSRGELPTPGWAREKGKMAIPSPTVLIPMQRPAADELMRSLLEQFPGCAQFSHGIVCLLDGRMQQRLQTSALNTLGHAQSDQLQRLH